MGVWPDFLLSEGCDNPVVLGHRRCQGECVVTQNSFVLGAIALLALVGCSAGPSDTPQLASSTPPLSGSSTPSMARVTGGQDVGIYDPYLGTKVYNSATPPPGQAYGR